MLAIYAKNKSNIHSLSVSRLRALNNEKFNSVMSETENIQVNSWGFS